MNDTMIKKFKGVWIPRSIWIQPNLTWMEKCLWAEVFFLGDKDEPCYASNAHLADVFSSTTASIANMLSNLRKLGYIIDCTFDGRNRKMYAVEVPTINSQVNQTSPVNEGSLNPEVKADLTDRLNVDTSIDTNRENRIEHNEFFDEPSKIHPTVFPQGGLTTGWKQQVLIGDTNKPKRQPKLADDEFISELKRIHPRIDIDSELRKMDAWLLNNPARKKTRQFITNWLNRVQVPLATQQPSWKPRTI